MTESLSESSQGVDRARPWTRAARCVLFASPWTLVVLMAWTDRPYLLDLASPFLLHAAAGAAAMGFVLVGMRRWGSGINLLLVAATISSGWRLSASTPEGGSMRPGVVPLRIVFYNMHLESSRHDNAAIQWVLSKKPDVIVLIEPPWGVLEDWPMIRREFPLVIEPESGMMWSAVVVSRWEGTLVGPSADDPRAQHVFVARRCLLIRAEGSMPVLVTAMHPPSPRTSETWRASLRDVELSGEFLRRWLEKTGGPVVVAGDFNSTPAGRVHRVFARSSGLRGWSPALAGGTWPAWLPRWLAIPIDRVWTGGGAVVRSIEVGPAFRSDHRPVFAEVLVPKEPEHPPADQPSGEPREGLAR